MPSSHELQRRGKQAYDAMPGKIGVVADAVGAVVRGVLAGRSLEAAALRDDATALRGLADMLDKAAATLPEVSR